MVIEAAIFADLPANPLVYRPTHSPASVQPTNLSIQTGKGATVQLFVYPGHQGASVPNNVYLIRTPDDFTVMHTGDQSEDLDWAWLDTSILPLLTLVRSFDSPFVQLSLDTGHALIMHHCGGPTPDQWVYEAGATVGHLHLQDVDGQLDRHWPPGMGNVKWAALFEALSTLDHLPRLLLELKDAHKMPQAMHYLGKLGLAQ